jgi:hypothetical protein
MADSPSETPSEPDHQAKFIAQSQETIQANSFMMLRHLDLGEVDDAFRKASKLVEPLITSDLSPRNYYVLYHLVSTALIELSVAITDPSRIDNRQVAEQYEVVQYHKMALPRLYLMITVAPELATRKIVRILEVIEDVTEMLKQAQDPVHALFIRHFLLSVFKQHLPDTTPQDRDRSLRFLLTNFAQMNRMWVRIPETIRGGTASSERADLSVLVGTNIQRITSLHGLTAETYSQIILPFIAKHVELCEDELAQEFILQSIVHAFPEDFHFVTVERLFAVFGRVEQGVKILYIVNQLLDRFLNYVGGLIDPDQGRQMFLTIAKNIEELFNQEGHLALVDKFETLEKLVRFALRINREDLKNVKNLMRFTQYHIDLAIGAEVLTQPVPSAKLRTLIECPLSTFTQGQQVFGLDDLPGLLARLLPDDRRALAVVIANLFINGGTRIGSREELQYVLSLTVSLVREGPIRSCFYALFHLVDGGSVIGTMGLLQELANAMEETADTAADKAVLPIGFIALKLIPQSEPDELRKLVQFIVVYGKNAAARNPSTAVFLFAEAARVLERVEGSEDAAAELAETAVQLWIDLTNIPAKERLFNYVIQFVLASRSADLALNAHICNFASTFADPATAIRALANCAPLFWRQDERARAPSTVQACLAKATKAAATATELKVMLEGLYVVLGWTAYCLASQIALQNRWVHALLDLITAKHQELKDKGTSLDSVVTPQAKTFYVNTARFIQDRQLVGPEGDDADEGDEGDEGEDDEEVEATPAQPPAQDEAEEPGGENEEDEAEEEEAQ